MASFLIPFTPTFFSILPSSECEGAHLALGPNMSSFPFLFFILKISPSLALVAPLHLYFVYFLYYCYFNFFFFYFLTCNRLYTSKREASACFILASRAYGSITVFFGFVFLNFVANLKVMRMMRMMMNGLLQTYTMNI